jgi:signal transduction histidine kinase
MIRSIQNRILLLIGIIALCMVVGLLISQKLEKQRISSLLIQETEDNAILLAKVFDFMSKSLNNFTFDYTYWDDMVSFANNPDPNWATGNIEVSLPTFDLDYAWVYSKELENLYSCSTENANPLSDIPLSEKQILELIADDSLYTFFVKTSEHLIQISGGSIHPTNDPERKTLPQGYLFVGRIWTEDYLGEMEELTGTELSIAAAKNEAQPIDSIVLETYCFKNFIVLSGYNEKPLSILASTGMVEIAGDFSNESKTNAIILSVLLLISLLLFSFALIRWINKPLKSLITSLLSDNSHPISDLAKQKSEFGHIAKLMNEFFAQKAKLIEEITQRKKIERELILARNKAEESERLKTAFLNNISHEIRTPMNAIVGFSELLLDKKISEQDRNDFTRIIRDSSNRLLGMITDLINISTIEAGQEVVTMEKIALNIMLDGIFSNIRKEVDLDSIDINLSVPRRDDDTIIISDREKLDQILTNLLRNSVKFTKSGKIEFGYSLSESEIEFFVKDTGIGIPNEKFDNIFARFEQADNSLSREFGGAGLGLPISRAYVELLGGRIWLQSEVGQGTEFYFTIPLRTSENSCPVVN